MNIHSDFRAFWCDACGGDGGFDENCMSVGGYESSQWVECSACGGKGEFVAELLPVTRTDMEELAHEAC